MTDICKCSNSDCPLAAKCYRHTRKSNPLWQSFAMFHPDWQNGTMVCEYYLPAFKVLHPRNKEKVNGNP